jgi:uncharacterized membrane protein HdeD (DUF308 family)
MQAIFTRQALAERNPASNRLNQPTTGARGKTVPDRNSADPDNHAALPPKRELAKFWWVFAVRGGGSLLYALALVYIRMLFGAIFFDPILWVFLSLLLGFYVLSNGILLGVAAGFATEQHLRIRWLLAAECLFAIALGIYIGFSLSLQLHSLAVLAGLHALSAGCFQAFLAFEMRTHRLESALLALAAAVSLPAAALFLTHPTASVQSTTGWLSLFELAIGLILLAFAYSLHRPTSPTGQ